MKMMKNLLTKMGPLEQKNFNKPEEFSECISVFKITENTHS